MKCWSVSKEGQQSWWSRVLWGGCSEVQVVLFCHVSSEKTRGNDLKLHQRKINLTLENFFSLKEDSGIGISCSARCWSHLWTHLRGNWMWHWGIWCKSGYSGALLMIRLDDLESLFHPWWFHMILCILSENYIWKSQSESQPEKLLLINTSSVPARP